MQRRKGGGRYTIFDDPVVLQEMIDRYQAGESSNQLGKYYGKAHTTILFWLKKNGVPRRVTGGGRSKKIRVEPMYRTMFDDPKVNEPILKLFHMGYSIGSIALSQGVSPDKLGKWLKKNNITRPHRNAGTVRGLPRLMPDLVDERDRCRPVKSYEEILTDAAKRGSKACAAALGGRYNSE